MPNARFGCFDVDLAAGQVHKRGRRVRLREKSFQVLAALLEHPGQVVTRDELHRRLWPDNVFVDFDNNLNTAIAALREALGDSADRPRFIETLPRHGYRFLAPVSRPQLPERPPVTARLAVLPFVSPDGDGGPALFADAVTDEIIAGLARLAPDRLAVIARTTAMRYKDTHKDVATIGRELNVDYVLEGAVRRDDGRVALHAQLIRCDDQTQVLARQYDTDVAGAFDVERSFTREIAAHVGVRPDDGPPESGAARSANASRRPTKNPEAYDEYIKGRQELGRVTTASMATAKAHLERAIAMDPEFALAYDALADLYWHRGYFGFTEPREAFSAGILCALRALEIDGTLAETHALVGQFHKQLHFNWPEVEREMARALELDPASPTVRLRYAVNVLMPRGRLTEAIAEMRRALEYDPLSPGARAWLVVLLVLSRQFDEALDEARRLLELEPTAYWGHAAIAATYRELRRFDEAIAAQRRATELAGGSAIMIGWLGLLLGLAGRMAEARSQLDRLETMASKAYVPPTSFAWIYIGMGDVDRAFEWLDRAVEGRDQLMMPIKSYGFFDPLRSDPRFAALLGKMNLAG